MGVLPQGAPGHPAVIAASAHRAVPGSMLTAFGRQRTSAGGPAASATDREVGLFGQFLAEGPITTQLGIAVRLLIEEFGLLGVGLLAGGIT